MGFSFHRHQSSFATGEISPELDGARPDLERYPSGVRKLENFLVTETGAVVARPGTRHVAPVNLRTQKSRLVPFVFSRDQAYTIEFGHLVARIFKEDGLVESSPGVPYKITGLPWATGDLPSLRWEQSGDQLYVFHPSYQTRVITRLGHASWSVALYAPDDGPFLPENVTGNGVQAAAALGASIALTAPSGTFENGDAGSLMRLAAEDLSGVQKWVGNVDYTAGDKVRSNGHVYEAANTANSGPNAPSHTKGDESAGHDGTTDYVTWTYLHSGYGIVRISAVGGGGSTATATVLKRLPDEVVSASTLAWSKGAWSDGRGWPAIGRFHEQRLFTAGAPGDPLTLNASQSADFDNMDLGDGAGADAISITLPTLQRDGVNWMVSASELIVGTIGQEHLLRSSREGEALTPTNINRKKTTDEGSAFVDPVAIGEAILFVARDGKRLVEQAFQPSSASESGYVATDIDRFSRHIARRGIAELAWQRDPFRVVWMRLADGGLASLTYRRAEQLVAWARHPLGGTDPVVESICVSPTTAGGEDELWLIVRRTVDGVLHRYVERLAAAFDYDTETTAENAFQVDSGLPLSGPAVTFGGFEHLAGETLVGVGDGRVLGPAVVSATGTVTWGRSVTAGCAGLAFTPRLETLTPETAMRDGPSTGRKRSLSDVIAHVKATAGGRISAWNGQHSDQGLPLDDAEDEPSLLLPYGGHGSGPLPLSTGPIEGLSVGGGLAIRKGLIVTQPDPLPMKITGLSFDVEVETD